MNYRQLHENIHADFVFEKKLKSGQRGNIYLVRDKNTGERSVYRHFYGNAEVYESLVNITCPNLPKITRTGEEDGKVLVLEEYIQGDGLDFILEGGALTFGQTRDIAIQVCRALCILHSVGAVHRDVKPENIILRGNEAVLIDFDASRMYKLEQTSDTRVMGTTGYAAPEQYGFSQTDARADLYAVGVLINEMLTNRHPATCLAEGPMRPIIEKCIEVNVDKRYLSADELLFALEALTDKNIAAALEKKKRQSAAKKLLGITAVAAVFVMGMLMGRIGEEESEAVSGSVQTSNLSTVTSSEPVSKKMPAVEIVREVMPAKPEKTDFEKIGILSDVPIDLIWDGVTRIEPFKRNGTYQVQNGAELAWIASRINSGENIDSIELTDDIDLGGCQWEPIEKYSGEFDGNGHTISGMKIDSKALENNGQHLGLFGTIAGKNVSNAVIKNFTLGGEIIASSTEQIHDGRIGGVAGHLQNAVAENITSYVDISVNDQENWEYVGGLFGNTTGNVQISACVNNGMIIGETKVGGIVGQTFDETEITRCSNNGYISGSDSVGGIAGIMFEKTMISECSNAAPIVSQDMAGGITGVCSLSSSIDRCFNAGMIYAEEYSGGIAGSCNTDGQISNCYNTAEICAVNTKSGGLIGWIGARKATSEKVYIKNCFTTGRVFGEYGSGVAIGVIDADISISDVYYLDSVADSSDISYANQYGILPVTEKALQRADFVNSINSDNAFVTGIAHPRLSWQPEDEVGGYGKMNISRVYRNSDNGIVEMSADGTGGFYWTIDESDLTKPTINFVYAGNENNRQDIMKALGYSEESENFPLTVELDYPEGYENVIHGVDEGETDIVMRVCSVRNGILEEGVNDFWFEWYDSDGEHPTFRQTITLKIDYGSGFDVATPFDTAQIKDTPGTLNIQTVYRSTTDGDIALSIDKFDYRIGYATDSSGSITDVRVTYAYTGPSLSAAEMKEHLHFFDDKTSRIIMKLAPPKGYNGMKRSDGTEDGFFHAVVAQNGAPREDKRTYTVTWTDSTGSLPDLTQKIVFSVDYGGRISVAPTGYAPTITTVETLPDWVGQIRVAEMYRETANGDISLSHDVFDTVIDDSDVFDVPITFVYKGRSKRIDELTEEMDLTDPNSVITIKLLAPKGYNGYTRLDGNEELFFHAIIAKGDELIEEEKVYTITWQDSTGSLPSFKQKIRLKADFGNLV